MKKIRKAIFPVGGLGTRFLPATKALPKEMLPVIDKPLIQFAVEEAAAAGIEEFIFITGRGKTAIEDHFDFSFELNTTLEDRGKSDLIESINKATPVPGSIVYIRQQHPMGLGHAVWCARHLINDEPFAVILADDLILADKPCLAQMIDGYRGRGSMIAAQEVPESEVSRYGIFNVKSRESQLIQASNIVEKPSIADAPSRFAAIGRYILTPSVFDYLDKKITGSGGEIQLTDAIANTIKAEGLDGFLFEGTRFDCGSKEGMLLASLHLALERDDLAPYVKEFLQRKIAC